MGRPAPSVVVDPLDVPWPAWELDEQGRVVRTNRSTHRLFEEQQPADRSQSDGLRGRHPPIAYACPR